MEEVINLKKAVVTKEDGSTEIVYVPDSTGKMALKDKLTIAYTAIGILAATFTVILTVRQLKKK